MRQGVGFAEEVLLGDPAVQDLNPKLLPVGDLMEQLAGQRLLPIVAENQNLIAGCNLR